MNGTGYEVSTLKSKFFGFMYVVKYRKINWNFMGWGFTLLLMGG
jgi:hypothetical protein